MSLRKLLAGLALAALALSGGSAFAQAAPYNPMGNIGINGGAPLPSNFLQYTGQGGTLLGTGDIDISKTFWLYEKRGTYSGQTVDSWLVFWDPAPPGAPRAHGTVSWDQSILSVFSTRNDLMTTGALGFERAGYTYNYTTFVGIEASQGDYVSFLGKTMTLDFTASDPGDYVRVFTAVPEPGTYAQLAADLWVLGWVARRRLRAGAAAA